MQPENTITQFAVIAIEAVNEERAQPWKSAYPQVNTIAGYKFEQGSGGGSPKTQGN